MKLTLCLLLFLPLLAHAQAGDWPRNPQTGKVELRGTLPWPATVITPAQRRQLVRRWYFAKFTEQTPVQAQASHEKLTYDGLPQVVYLDYQPAPGRRFRLLSEAVLSPTAAGLAYQLTNLEVAWGEEDVASSYPLEEMPANRPTHQQAVALLHKRLAAALAGW